MSGSKENKRANTDAEHHLFIIWEKARQYEKEILGDITKNFELISKTEVTWSPEKFSENLSRFYGANLPPGSGKEEHCGTGPFLVVIIKDHNPVYNDHETTSGLENVNSNVFLSKSRYREISLGGHKIHATNSTKEFDHDAALLFGDELDTYLTTRGRTITKRIHKDLAGAHGWSSLEELFFVLNKATRYVVMRNFDPLPGKYYSNEHGDIDILTDDYVHFQYVSNATPVFPEEYRVHNRVSINGEEVLFDFRYVGDGYYDTAWQKNILASRLFINGIFIPNERNHFYSLLYHALIHKYEIADDYVEKINQLNSQQLFTHRPINRAWFMQYGCSLLGSFLADNKYAITVPEESVRYNTRAVEKTRRGMWKRKPFWYLKKRVLRTIR